MSRGADVADLGRKLVLVAAAFVVVVHLPERMRSLADQRAATAGLTREQRELAGGRSVDIDQNLLRAAQVTIPSGATYYVLLGEHTQLGNIVTLAAAPPFIGYWLLPRRQVLDPAQADWIVSYGGDLPSLGLAYGRRVEPVPGLVVTEVMR